MLRVQSVRALGIGLELGCHDQKDTIISITRIMSIISIISIISIVSIISITSIISVLAEELKPGLGLVLVWGLDVFDGDYMTIRLLHHLLQEA